MEEQQVCLPGIGTLRLSPQAAVISPIEGKVTPPSNRATFNSNLVLDDGRILGSLKEIPILSDQEAEHLMAEYLKDIRDTLDAGRSVSLEGVGRLFKHFDGEIRFTAGGENFSKESFGLPAVELKPIARSEKQRRTAADPMLAGTTDAAAVGIPPRSTATVTEKPKSTWQQIIHHQDLKQILWYVAAIMATVAILSLGYLLLKTVADNSGSDPMARVDAQPVKVTEPATRQPLPPVDADRVVPEEPPRLNDARSAEPAPFEQPEPGSTTSSPSPTAGNGTDEPAVTDPPTQSGTPYNIAFIATGLYGSSTNVSKNKDRISQTGFEAFARAEGRYTRVGVRVQYTERGDLMETLRAIQKQYDDAFVMEINGEKVRID